MRSLIRFAVDNPVAANLVFVGVLALGGLLLGTLPREVFPEFSREGVEVQVVYPNASPEEVERLVVIPIEEACDSVEGTYEVTSFSKQSWARVLVDLHEGTDRARYLDELRMEIDAIEDWPEDAEEPRIFEQRVEFPVITVNLHGSRGQEVLRRVAEDLRDSLKRVPHVASVRIFGLQEPELWVEVTPESLERFGVTLAEISALLGSQVRDLPGGSLETSAGEIQLRVLGEETDPEEIARRVVRALPDGSLVRVGDLARVTLGYEPARNLSRYNGYPNVSLNVAKDARGDVIDIVDRVEEIVNAARTDLPAGLSLGVSSDFSIYVQNRLRTLLQSGLFGLAIVLLILWAFLDARVAFMTALGIPVAVMGGIVCMSLLGITMNMLSMFAFILVLGLVVDDAVVVVENSYRYLEQGMRPRDAALLGASEVAWPVLTTVATTVLAFGSMLMIQGEMGKWMEPVPWVAGLTLLSSLIEALIVLPSHFADWLRPVQANLQPVRVARKHGGRWYAGVQKVYERLLRGVVRHRYATLVAAVAVLTWAGALFDSGHLKFVLLPRFEAKLFMMNVETPPHYSLEQTAAAMGQLEEAMEVVQENELESYVALAGATYSDQSNYRSGNYLGQVFVELAEGGDRTRTTGEIQDALRERIGAPPDIRRLEFFEPDAGPVGAAIELALTGPRVEDLREVADAIETYLAGFAGVRDIRDDLVPGNREVQVRLTDEGRLLGFTEANLARQVLGAFSGDRASILRLDRDPADLLVRNPEEARYDFRLLREMRVRSPAGASVPLWRVAELEEGRGLVEVVRRDRRPAVTITADVTVEGNSREIVAEVQREFADVGERWSGVEIGFGGDREQTLESMASLGRAIVVAFLGIYFLLAFLFRSYLQPIVVLSSVPFGVIGVVFGFTAIGEPLSFMTMLGVLALSGVAVNDALVLVDFVNQHRAAGHGVVASVLRAGSVRMRPVLITSITTIGGLFPLGFFSSGQARFLAPMAQAMIFGMVTATLMTLLLVPAGYLVLHDLRRLGARLLPSRVRSE